MEASPTAEPVRLGGAFARWTTKADGDFQLRGTDGPGTETQRRAVVDREWTWLTQEHGVGVVRVGDPFANRGEPGDALITDNPRAALAIRTADCGSLAVGSTNGWFAGIHAGWNGLVSGVVEAAIASLREHGAQGLVAGLGPCIHPRSYAFSGHDLDRLAARFGDDVRQETAEGQPAFDLPRAIRVSLERVGVPLAYDADICTAEAHDSYYSHRARQDKERQALVVWSAL